MEKREIPICILLSIVTCGFYTLYWMVTLTDDMNYLYGTTEVTGIKVLLFTLITCGIYGIYWSYKMGIRVDELKANHGLPTSSSGIVYLVISLFGLRIITYALIQSEINRYMPSDAGTV